MRKKSKEKYKSPFCIGQYNLPEEYTAYLENKIKKLNDENINNGALTQTPTHRGKKGRQKQKVENNANGIPTSQGID